MSNNNNRALLTERHSFINDTIFRTKISIHTVKRLWHNTVKSIPRFTKAYTLSNAHMLSFSESNLWNPNDNKDNWILTAGKIENLRIAVKKINGIEVKANEVFSFWKHIGNPNFGKGYVVGREIREGCIVPTIAGGLCQLSNALYDAALKANFEIVERHRHTKVVQGSLAEQDRDATVKWNYIDLRFRYTADFRIEATLSNDKLIITFKSNKKNSGEAIPRIASRNFVQLNDCFSCGNTACFKHPNRSGVKQESGLTAYVLDDCWKEFNNYLKENGSNTDYCLLPLPNNRWVKTNRYCWSTPNPKRTKALTIAGINRAVKTRKGNRKGLNPFELSLEQDQKIATAAAKKIPLEVTHVVVQQNLLPFLYASGALGGRTFDVFMTRLPLQYLQEQLDKAFALHPDSTTLKDFRAPETLIAIENKALTQARTIITPHTGIAALFTHKTKLIPWVNPEDSNLQPTGNQILLPASGVGRKGAYEVKQLAKELNIPITVTGKASENNDFWETVEITKFDGDFTKIALVVYPAFIEHQPRQLLKALAYNIPVVATPVCGLPPNPNLHIIPVGNYHAFKNKVVEILEHTPVETI
ncbi:hypothetical protein NBRC110019_20620 [Neptunitalea chrysea]|uniref:VanW like protein n=1 Tax=Neptunitalea chrysea TaxID=1647581 RepID=A0A9W6B7X4_9FLAO|nr:VanW family protein [Neptunitalea chrysea]GLB53022.1 hypothetical protein NBRC110019_20620 [Neptunitalea chrysea]